MRKLLFSAACGMILLSGCSKNDLTNREKYNREIINQNVQKIFGTTFSENHTWSSTVAGEITVSSIPEGTEELELIVLKKEEDGETSILILNTTDVTGKSSATLSYDAPESNEGLYVVYISKTSYNVKKVENNTVSSFATTKALPEGVTLPEGTPVIGAIDDSYASIRNWNPGEKLYQLSDYTTQKISVSDYSDEFKDVFRSFIFSYFKNGRKYNNLPLVVKSGYYNHKAYPLTTGKDPIIVSPVYKNDGGYKEVVNSDLYYYYFDEKQIGAQDTVEFLESLPKYKAIQFDQCIKADDEICKHASYALIYWGEGTPELGTTGSYTFPEGYKIGFMVRAKTTAENNRKQGELYGDGRLNNSVNKYGSFSSSKLGTDGPRMAWLTVNGRVLVCCESGTDTDFNDIILEIEGGVDPVTPVPELENNVYTFCFEDTLFGDYDMNDVVIKAKRISDTKVEYSLVACGAYDNLQIMNINGNKINQNTEVHKILGVEGGYVNTVKGRVFPVVTETVTVDKNFSFTDESTQPYIIDLSTNKTIKISRKGEDPHGIMIPYDFKYPLETVCVKDAYTKFNSWGQNPVESTEWYLSPVEDKVFVTE